MLSRTESNRVELAAQEFDSELSNPNPPLGVRFDSTRLPRRLQVEVSNTSTGAEGAALVAEGPGTA
jgi:hypothetical protein